MGARSAVGVVHRCPDLGDLVGCRRSGVKQGVKPLALTILLVTVFPALAQAGDVNAALAAGSITVRGTLVITITAPIAISFSPATPSVACQAPPGTVVATMSATGGDNTPITWSLAGDTTDFAISGAKLVVGPNGIAASTCPVAPATTTTINETVTATQS